MTNIQPSAAAAPTAAGIAVPTPHEGTALVLLSLAYFTVGVTSLEVVGVLGPMGHDLEVTPGAAAGLVTAFALAFAVAAPLAQALATRWTLPTLLVGGLVLLAAGCVGTALAGDYPTALGLRIACGAAAALVGPSASAVGAALVPAHRRGRALGTVFAGATLATVVGVPLATWLGSHLSWRTVFLLVAALALAIALAVRLRVPGHVGAGRARLGLAEVATLMGRRAVGSSILASLLQMVAQFVTYALLGALMAERFGSDADQVSLALFVFGVAGMAGNALAARMADGIGVNAATRLSFGGMALSFVALIAAPGYAWSLAALAGWAAFSLMLMTPQQKRLVMLAGDRTAVALGLNSSAIYVGIALGSSLGGGAYGLFGGPALPLLSLAVTAAAALAAEWAMRAPDARRL
ncbi:MFS transporter [Azospirillum picis]|uniref:DHA1 family inner membrane transport protein n=1 Tax=Azospirillum picis TaxID=488438 RepID=A0ABU0MJS3_9PROT|nr:MFS transporter [Azospirillum picis]MBP2299835.1 DHA1 family inner membrane transport protein [Azospirillum picis]MDQ0533631.1 DHA1 family inner membrane transport protein [Azospirillum picis]